MSLTAILTSDWATTPPCPPPAHPLPKSNSQVQQNAVPHGCLEDLPLDWPILNLDVSHFNKHCILHPCLSHQILTININNKIWRIRQELWVVPSSIISDYLQFSRNVWHEIMVQLDILYLNMLGVTHYISNILTLQTGDQRPH